MQRLVSASRIGGHASEQTSADMRLAVGERTAGGVAGRRRQRTTLDGRLDAVHLRASSPGWTRRSSRR